MRVLGGVDEMERMERMGRVGRMRSWVRLG